MSMGKPKAIHVKEACYGILNDPEGCFRAADLAIVSRCFQSAKSLFLKSMEVLHEGSLSKSLKSQELKTQNFKEVAIQFTHRT